MQTRILRFVVAVFCLVLVVYLAQLPIRYIPAFNHYSKEADKHGLHPGALYYSDVPVTLDAEKHNRAAVKSVDDRHRQERMSRQ